MRVDLAGVSLGLIVLAAASAGARYLKEKMDAATGIEAVGWAMTLMIANILQLVGVMVVLAALFE